MSLLSVKCKLIPDASTAEKLSRTVEQFANACNYALQEGLPLEGAQAAGGEG